MEDRENIQAPGQDRADQTAEMLAGLARLLH